MPRRLLGLAAALLAGAAVLATAAPACAHVVPSTTIELDVHDSDITAALTLPSGDLVTASGITLPDADAGGVLAAGTAEQVANYLQDHLALTSGSGAWTVAVDDVTATSTEQYGTGAFAAVTATAVLSPPAGSDEEDLRTFTLTDDAIVHQVVTADTYVVLRSDEATGLSGGAGSARNLGEITLDTVTGTVAPLAVDLDGASTWPGLTGMVRLGVSHIAEGSDHQLFLLTLLLPAPLLAAGGRWRQRAPAARAGRRITAITLAFTLGHSATLALGALGLPVPQQPVEAAIALSILIAAAHAVRPLFPGREPLVAAAFGLVHGLAFSTTLSAMDLSGRQLVLSLLGFNLGIELMQLAVVLLVLPPLVALARTSAYRLLRLGAAGLTAVAATGWLLQRLGAETPLGTAADAVGPTTPWIALALWLAAGLVVAQRRTRRDDLEPSPSPQEATHHLDAALG